jgi:hypothetical protein
VKSILVLLLVACTTAAHAASDESLFQRVHEAMERWESRDFVMPNLRTGYVERGFDINTGNDSQSRQLERLFREMDEAFDEIRAINRQ